MRTQNLRGQNRRGQNLGTNPSVAFGGRSFSGSRTRGSGFSRVPADVSGGWDRGHEHTWNNHRWGWRDNDWIILDGGVYGDFGPDYTYEYSTSSGGGLAASVQRALDRDGYNAGPADGVIGPQTRDAIASFQSDHGLAATGRINQPLLSALGLE